MEILRSEAVARIGDRVRARGERWRVAGIDAFDDCRIVTLVGTDAANRQRVKRLVTPVDRLTPVNITPRLRLVPRPEWRRHCRALFAAAGPASMLRTAITARMQLLPYQLEPALAMVRGLGSRLLIADAVGLGKTVQAGLIAAELRARHAGAHILVVTPAGLREQWVHELADRFALPAALVGAAALRARRRDRPVDLNPWLTDDVVVASTDFVKRPDILRAVADVPWDLLIVDEAHGVVAPSDRHDAIARLARDAPHVVLLTATPHNGDERAFNSLCGLGDRHDELLVFRRTRRDASLPDDRRIHQLVVHPTNAERRLQALLRSFATAVERDREQADERVALVVATLRKRACSSPASLARSVERRLALVPDGSAASGHQIHLPFDDEGERDVDDLMPEWQLPMLRDAAAERSWLTRLAEAARIAAVDESKLRVLRRLLNRLREPAIVFTEYRDTLLHVLSTVAPDAAVLHGGLSREERRLALTRFARGRVLLATDAAGEGLNLQQLSRIVINLELPWNPMRLEQRIGRVDRIGQTARVHAFHLIAGAGDEAVVMRRLSARVAAADSAVGVANPLRRGSRGQSGSDARSFRLIDDAAAEAERLTIARALTRAARDQARVDPLSNLSAIAEIGAALIVPTRRLRRQIGSRRLIIVAFGVESADGWLVALEVRGILLPATPHLSITPLDNDIFAHMLETSAVEHGTDTHTTFWHRRISRLEQVSADHISTAAPVQTGLFDRREAFALARRRQMDLAARTDLLDRVERARRMIDLTSIGPVALFVVDGAGHAARV